MNTIPGKQLLTASDTVSGLRSLLLDRELGWCDTEGVLYFKRGQTVSPVSQTVVVEEGVSRGQIIALAGTGKVPILKVRATSGWRYLYPGVISPDNIVFFSDGLANGASEALYMSVSQSGEWTSKSIGEMTDAEIAALVNALP